LFLVIFEMSVFRYGNEPVQQVYVVEHYLIQFQTDLQIQ
jgi:hypothetical protein